MAKKKKEKPQENNWLFSCSPHLSLAEVRTILAVEKQPVIELSVRYWKDIHQMINDILRKYGYPNTYFYKKDDVVTLDGLRDWMFIQGWEGKQFIGEVFLLRDCNKEVADNLAFFVAIVSSRVDELQKRPHVFPSARIAVVLEGWDKPSLVGNVFRRRVSWTVQPLLRFPNS